MKTSWIAILVFLTATAPAPAADSCVALASTRKNELCRYVQRKNRLPDESKPAISGISELKGCYRRLRFVSTGKRRLDVTLILTPDQKFLVPELNDISIDPIADEQRKLAEARRELEKDDGRPSLGPADASVAIVVFSDFECPYCRQFAETARQVTAEERDVRLIFRNLPLDMHPWAREAAEIAACTAMQNRDAFWPVHDFLFEHQQQLTTNSLRPTLMGFIGSLRGVRADQVRACCERRSADSRLRTDLALASANAVTATPTFFIDGVRANGAPTREHLLTLIHENRRQVASAAAGASQPKTAR